MKAYFSTIAARLRSPLKLFLRLPLSLLRNLLILCLIGCLSFTPMPRAYAQTQPQLLKLTDDDASPQRMSPSELAAIDDPLLNLVLKDSADTKTLDGLTAKLKTQLDDESIFVVHERILDDTQQVNGRSALRRSVITFNDSPRFEDGPDGFELNQNNVALSVFFSPDALPGIPDIEAMAWDEKASQFNYYKLNRVAGETESTWKFRGTSKDADQLSASARQGTCMACHINGGMVMKEFKVPWNNWDSVDLELPYLRTGNGNSWPVAAAIAERSSGNGPTGAQALESMMQSANERFNRRRIATLQSNGEVSDVKRLLKPLFVTTEFNLMTSFGQDQFRTGLSGLHPFGPRIRVGELNEANIPPSFLFNDDLITDFQIFPEIGFPDFGNTQLMPQEYQQIVRQGETRLAGSTPGDTHFAWFTPEVSNIDVTYARTLVEQGVISKEFLAAVLSVDVENPVFSSDRERLWAANNILPTRFRTNSPDLLDQTRTNLERLNPNPSSAEGQFLAALQSSDPVQFLANKLNDYAATERARLNNPQVRRQEIARLYRKLLERRERVDVDPVLHNLNESSLLFPTGNIAALPNRIDEIATPRPNRPTLAVGDRGSAVEELQEFLKVLSFLTGPADGAFGPMTEGAVMTAQRVLGLDADGIVGPATWMALDQALALPVLRIGSQGDDVVMLQERLRDRGFLNGVIDGDFGPQTRRAVIAAQQQFELETDGIVGPSTWVRLSA